MMIKEIKYNKLLNILIIFDIWQLKIIYLYLLCSHMNANSKTFAFYLFYPLIFWSILFVCFFSFCYLLLFLSSANDNQHSHGKTIVDLS